MEHPLLLVVAAACAIAAAVWARSAYRLKKVAQRAEREFGWESDVATVARSAFRKDVHTSVLYLVLAVVTAAGATLEMDRVVLMFTLVLIPVLISVVYGRDFVRDSRLAESRLEIERRAEEVLNQEDLAPRAWAARLAPEDLPDVDGFEVGRVYQAGTGVMAGDFYDVFRVAKTRVAAVIGDVTGHGIEPSITAFQAKYLLRVFLRQYRDPAQALEELNAQLSQLDRGEEMISLCVVVFDTEASTVRYASAGHPAVWLWHDRDVRPLRSTGALLRLDPSATYHSRELRLDVGDLVLMYTDGLSEARAGDQLFGEERIANVIRKDPSAPTSVLVKSLLEAARDFAREPITDDIAILAVRRD
ncbi:MAG: PP2C family protein-serine/threonine phosphatase [Acidimicrobiales bacterium]